MAIIRSLVESLQDKSRYLKLAFKYVLSFPFFVLAGCFFLLGILILFLGLIFENFGTFIKGTTPYSFDLSVSDKSLEFANIAKEDE